MSISEKILIGAILINRLNELASRLGPYDENLDEYLKRAIMTKLRMKRFYFNNGEPAELWEQILEMDSIIKRLEQLQNNHVADM